MTEIESYRERLKGMTDADLRGEWERAEAERLRAAEHEMAVRFLGRRRLAEGEESSYFLRKYMELPDRFWEAYCGKEWPRAKMIYDDAIRIGLFLEVPEEVRAKVMGSRQNPEGSMEGMFPEWAVDRVMHECLIKNRLGHECVVYRVPGEIGFYGARRLTGTRHMDAEENPAYHAAQGRTEH